MYSIRLHICWGVMDKVIQGILIEKRQIDSLAQDCSHCSALTMELLQSCAKPSQCALPPSRRSLLLLTAFEKWISSSWRLFRAWCKTQ